MDSSNGPEMAQSCGTRTDSHPESSKPTASARSSHVGSFANRQPGPASDTSRSLPTSAPATRHSEKRYVDFMSFHYHVSIIGWEKMISPESSRA